MIYLDNAATSYHKPKIVYDAVVNAMKVGGNSGRGVNSASLSAGRILAEGRNKIKAKFNIPSAKNVIFTSGATESLNMAIFGLLKERDHVVTSVLEHNSVLRPLYALQHKGLKISYVPANQRGEITQEAVMSALQKNTKAVVITHASNVLGRINDIQEMGRILKEKGIYFIVDASQTAGLYDINLEKMNISALCFSAHKYIMGPQGIGVLALNEGVVLESFKYGGTGIQSYSKTMPDFYPEGLEAGTLNLPGVAGLLAGLDYIENRSSQWIKDKTEGLVDCLVSYLRTNRRYVLYGGDDYQNRTAVVPFNIQGIDSNRVSDLLFSKYQISIRSGAHCAPLCHKFLGTIDTGIIRVSFSHFNTEAEVRKLMESLEEIIDEQF